VSKFAKILAFVAATIIPLFAFLLASQRLLRVGVAFAGFLMVSVGPLLLLTAVILVLLAGAVFWNTRGWLRSPLLLRQFLRQLRRQRIGASLAVLFIIATAVPMFWYEYRLFSETYYQLRADTLFHNGRIAAAADLCQRYVALFPQRAENGGLPDPICTRIIDVRQRLVFLRDYVAAQKPRASAINGMVLPVEAEASAASLQILHAWTSQAPYPR
jgi:hypothetical protein